ncbi:hypothetical protein HK405_010864, partial [Cladochytrium tenue]
VCHDAGIVVEADFRPWLPPDSRLDSAAERETAGKQYVSRTVSLLTNPKRRLFGSLRDSIIDRVPLDLREYFAEQLRKAAAARGLPTPRDLIFAPDSQAAAPRRVDDGEVVPASQLDAEEDDEEATMATDAISPLHD